jgi:hypothetical protein
MKKSKFVEPIGASPRKASLISRDQEVQPLIVPRTLTEKLLGGVGNSYVRRLEKMGVLTPIRINPRSPVAMVFHSYAEVLALAQGKPVPPNEEGDDERPLQTRSPTKPCAE